MNKARKDLMALSWKRRWKIVRRQACQLGGRWEIGDGRWEIGDRRWEIGDRRWEIGNGR